MPCHPRARPRAWNGGRRFMKPYLLITLLALGLTACDQRKADIDATAREEKEALDAEKREVDRQTTVAKEQAEVDARIEKAEIEAQQQKEKAQIEADKKKAEIDANLRKQELDIKDQNAPR